MTKELWKTVGLLLAIAFALTGLTIAVVTNIARSDECRDHGGTYVNTRCLDVKEVDLP